MEIDLAPDGPEENVMDVANANVPVTENSVRFVSFYLGEGLYAIHAPSVAEVTHPLPVTNLPGSSDTLRGISSLRGEVVAKIDIKGLVDESLQNASLKVKTLILKSVNKDDTPIAFDVDRLGEIVSLPVNELRPVHGKANGFIFGESVVNGRSYFVLDHTKLLSAIS